MSATTYATSASEHSGGSARLRDHLISVIHGATVHVQAGYEDHIGLSDATALADALLERCGTLPAEP